MDARLPAHLEVGAILRSAQNAGGFGTVLHRGEKDAGTILILSIYRDEPVTLFERMPQLDGNRPFVAAKRENAENQQKMTEYLEKRWRQDPDIWVIELDIADAERFVASVTR